jgi:hypothetical protein
MDDPVDESPRFHLEDDLEMGFPWKSEEPREFGPAADSRRTMPDGAFGKILLLVASVAVRYDAHRHQDNSPDPGLRYGKRG